MSGVEKELLKYNYMIITQKKHWGNGYQIRGGIL